MSYAGVGGFELLGVVMKKRQSNTNRGAKRVPTNYEAERQARLDRAFGAGVKSREATEAKNDLKFPGNDMLKALYGWK